MKSARRWNHLVMKSFGWNHRFAMVKFSPWENLVGLSGLEPPTSCLSGMRSNHLSYNPLSKTFGQWRVKSEQWIGFSFSLLTFTYYLNMWWRWWDSNPWPPACRAGALPTELHPHIWVKSEEWKVKSFWLKFELVQISSFSFLFYLLSFLFL